MGASTPVDRHVLVVTYVLALIGLVMVFSASGVMAESRYQESTYFLAKQATWLAVGLLTLHAASYLNYEVWRNFTILIVGFIILLLILVLLPSLGAEVKGARRWLRMGTFSLQPAEMAKLAVVFYLATYLSRKGDRITEFAYFFPPILIVGLMAALILAQPDMGYGCVAVPSPHWNLVHWGGSDPASLWPHAFAPSLGDGIDYELRVPTTTPLLVFGSLAGSKR